MKHLSLFLAAFASFALVSCGQGDILFADKAVVNLSPVEGNPSVGYMELHGGRQEVDLLGVTSDDAVRLEMHETVEEDGVARMQPLKKINVPPGATVKMEPGGKHVMLWGISESAIRKGLLPLVLIYSNDDRILVQAVIKKPTSAGTVKPEIAKESDTE